MVRTCCDGVRCYGPRPSMARGRATISRRAAHLLSHPPSATDRLRSRRQARHKSANDYVLCPSPRPVIGDPLESVVPLCGSVANWSSRGGRVPTRRSFHADSSRGTDDATQFSAPTPPDGGASAAFGSTTVDSSGTGRCSDRQPNYLRSIRISTFVYQ